MGPHFELEQELDARQRQAVTHGSGALLVLGGPGSGKTRVLTHRIAYLVREHGVSRDSILAVTFTNKAAEELRLRLDQLLGGRANGMWIHTFHATCLRILRAHGTAIGLHPHFVVFDESAQADVISYALQRVGGAQYLTDRDFTELRDFIAMRKAALVDPGYDSGEAVEESAFAKVGEAYQDILREYKALDFDDLILYAVELLRQEDEVRAELHRGFAYVLVDEGHDMNPAQYAFLRLVIGPQSNVMVVADDNQSIYGWRGANPDLTHRFRRDYGAKVIMLEQNYRSTSHIVAGCQHLIKQNPSYFPRRMYAKQPAGERIEHHLFQTAAQEQEWFLGTMHRLVQDEGYEYGDIAILYRTHWLADTIYQYLLNAEVPLQRIQRENFFQRYGAREMLRHLQMLPSFADPALRIALNFPRVIADELTMLQLHRLALREDISLAQLARNLDAYPEVSPLTRAAVRSFLEAIDHRLLPHVEEDISRIVERLVAVLERRRSPYPEEMLPTLAGFASLLSLDDEVSRARAALDAGRPIIVLVERSIDAFCGGIILEHALKHYLGVEVSLQQVNANAREHLSPTGRGLTILLGSELEPTEEFDGIILRPRQAGTISYSLSTIAWRLAQALLVSYETLDNERFVIYDLETTGTSPLGDEIVEIGAITVDRRREVGEPFHSLVRPRRGYVPREATEVHGITWEDVRGSPQIDAVLPRFMRYLGDAVLAGHNIHQFDNLFIDREMQRTLGRRLSNPSLDTLQLARRLLPRANHGLEALLQHFKLGESVAHRAPSDCRQERDLLFRLLAENRWQKQLESLTELLPLVAIGMMAAGVPLTDENRSLQLAAARVTQRQEASPWVERVLDLLPSELWLDASGYYAQLQDLEVPLAVDDERWVALKRDWEAQLGAFQGVSSDRSLQAFLDYAALATDEDRWRPDQTRVTLMTLHNAKGKEFPVVFIVAAEEGNVPYWRYRESEGGLEEERRVFYVGMTRAKERLYISSVMNRGDRRRNPSPFAAGLPSEHILREYHYR